MFLKNKNIIFKIRRSKVTDYAPLIRPNYTISYHWAAVRLFDNELVKYTQFTPTLIAVRLTFYPLLVSSSLPANEYILNR